MSLVPRKKRHDVERVDFDRPFSPLARFRNEMDDLFARTFGTAWDLFENGLGTFSDWSPTLDISETDKEISLKAEVPGMDPKDLEITVAGNTLTICGSKKEVHEDKNESFFHSERRFGSFRRSVQLPASVDAENVTAEHKNGVVHIRLPKRPDALRKRIPVKSADQL